jgi:phage-related protein (TIGR01555 family)
MGAIRFLSDKLVNLVANLGTERDKSVGSTYAPALMTDEELVNAYRGAWLPRKIVDIPAMDSCRKWRNWQADKKQIERIEAEEKRLGIKAKVLEAMIKARLFGGAAVFIGTGERDPSQPLDFTRIRAGGIKYLTVMTRRNLHPTEIEQDPQSERYGRPKAYTLAGGSIQIHPSRLIEFIGARHPDSDLAMGVEQGWGDSVLLAVMEAVKHADSTMANIASLIFEAKVDVIRIPDFMQNMQDKAYEKQILERLRLAAMAKGINGTLILDKEEEYESKSASFGTLPDILDRFLQVVSGAADIPATRLLSQAPAGMSATGESDLRNYYDRVQAMQELETAPALYLFDECLIRSALGSRPSEIHYAWAPLWQSTAKEKSDIGKTTADTIKVLKDSGLFPEDALSKAAVTLLVENGVVPGLESAISEFGSELPDEEDGDDVPQSGVQQAGATRITDAAPRTLYVSRTVTNAADIIAWAKSQGFETTLPADDLHVTVAYSRRAVNWMKVGDSWSGDRDGKLSIAPGGARLIERFGEGAVVLLFNSSELAWRHVSIIEAGASWDWPEYQPHITFTYEPGTVDLSKVEPYRGVIELGPEIFAEVVENWQDKLKE